MALATFQCGALDLVYETHGVINEAADNCVLLPTYYAGTHASYARMIGPGRVLDPARYFIVIPNMLGNGVSSSPSKSKEFLNATVADNVHLQYQLLRDLGVSEIKLLYGWSMGAMQGYSWAALYPTMVKNFLAVCGSARCWPLNRVFLEGIAAAMGQDNDRRAFGRCYAGWAYSAAFYHNELYKPLGFETLEAFLKFWEDDHLGFDARDLMAMLWTWKNADLDNVALAKITARTIIMPADRDMYFTMEEARIEATAIKHAELRPLYSLYGHCAGAPGRFGPETLLIEAAMRELLA